MKTILEDKYTDTLKWIEAVSRSLKTLEDERLRLLKRLHELKGREAELKELLEKMNVLDNTPSLDALLATVPPTKPFAVGDRVFYLRELTMIAALPDSGRDECNTSFIVGYSGGWKPSPRDVHLLGLHPSITYHYTDAEELTHV